MSTRLTATNSDGYPAPAGIAVDVVIFTVADDQLQVLLVQRTEDEQRGAWALPGGFMGQSENFEDTARRKLAEKTGMSDVYVEQLGAYGDPHRDRRGWIPSVAYLALVPHSARPADSQATWHPISELPPLAFDHGTMIQDALDRLEGKLWWSNIAVGVLPPEFTLSQARAVYEVIAGRAYDPAGFARDLKATGLIEPTGVTRREGPGRPAALFRFVSRQLQWGAGRRKRVA